MSTYTYYSPTNGIKPRAMDGAGCILHGGSKAYQGLIKEPQTERKPKPVPQPPSKSTGKAVHVEVIKNSEGADVCFIVEDRKDVEKNNYVWQMLYKRGTDNMRAYPLLAKEWRVFAVIADQGWMDFKLSLNRNKPVGTVEVFK